MASQSCSGTLACGSFSSIGASLAHEHEGRPIRTIAVALPDAAATLRAGEALAPAMAGGMVVTLEGDLGAGKTTLVRGLLRARGAKGAIKSPTYALVEHYPLSSLYFYHIDFYRFDDPDEWETSGLPECFRNDSVCLIEWPRHVASRLPRPDLAVALAPAPGKPHNDGRVLTARAHSAAGERCVDALERAFPHATPTR
jgi:tRNA threonylcarbamoyladenosine biosynthesis protein TsaE